MCPIGRGAGSTSCLLITPQPPVGGDPNDLLVLGTDDTLSADPNDKG